MSDPRMSDPTNALPESLPAHCVRGPDGVSPEALMMVARAIDDAALAEYARGLGVLGEIRRLLLLREQRTAWVQQRDFALARLRGLERTDPWLVAEVLAAMGRGGAQ